MSREIGSRLPAQLIEEFSKEIPRLDAIPVISLDHDGFPHIALLSYFEAVFQNQTLYFFLNSSSRSTRFLREQPPCALLFVHSNFVYCVKGRAHRIGDCDSQTLFQVEIESILEDFPSEEEGQVFLETGIRFSSGQEETERRIRLREKIVGRILTKLGH